MHLTQITAQPELLEGRKPGGVPMSARALSSSVAIVSIAAGLMAIGSVMTVSAAAARADGSLIGWRFWEFPVMRQMVFVIGGLIAMVVAMHVPYRIFTARRGLLAKLMLGAAILATAAVLVPGIGVEVNGARRWIQVGPASAGLRFQPSEIVKITMPIFLAAWMGVSSDIRRFRTGFLPAVFVLAVGLAVVGKEDFGTAALIACVGGMMLLVGGARWWHVMLIILPGLAGFAYLLISDPARMARVMTFMDIWKDPEGGGYQVIQSLCTIASGGVWGRGLGHGFVKGYLPEARTDFVFAVICEELGIIGAAGIIGLLLVLLWQGLKAMLRCNDASGRLLAFGITMTLGVQAAMNIAVVTVSVPTKGISLPLVSAGGSGAIFLGALTGILANVARSGPLIGRCPNQETTS